MRTRQRSPSKPSSHKINTAADDSAMPERQETVVDASKKSPVACAICGTTHTTRDALRKHEKTDMHKQNLKNQMKETRQNEEDATPKKRQRTSLAGQTALTVAKYPSEQQQQQLDSSRSSSNTTTTLETITHVDIAHVLEQSTRDKTTAQQPVPLQTLVLPPKTRKSSISNLQQQSAHTITSHLQSNNPQQDTFPTTESQLQRIEQTSISADHIQEGAEALASLRLSGIADFSLVQQPPHDEHTVPSGVVHIQSQESIPQSIEPDCTNSNVACSSSKNNNNNLQQPKSAQQTHHEQSVKHGGAEAAASTTPQSSERDDAHSMEAQLAKNSVDTYDTPSPAPPFPIGRTPPIMYPRTFASFIPNFMYFTSTPSTITTTPRNSPPARSQENTSNIKDAQWMDNFIDLLLKQFQERRKQDIIYEACSIAEACASLPMCLHGFVYMLRRLVFQKSFLVNIFVKCMQKAVQHSASDAIFVFALFAHCARKASLDTNIILKAHRDIFLHTLPPCNAPTVSVTQALVRASSTTREMDRAWQMYLKVVDKTQHKSSSAMTNLSNQINETIVVRLKHMVTNNVEHAIFGISYFVLLVLEQEDDVLPQHNLLLRTWDIFGTLNASLGQRQMEHVIESTSLIIACMEDVAVIK